MRWMFAVCVFAVCVAPAHANVKLAPIFADNMVLQRDMPVPIWGTAAAAEAVTVTFAGQKKSTELPNTGVAAFNDSDADLHPRKKKLAGDRLALAARSLVYGEKIVASGPTVDKVVVDWALLIVHFKNTGGGLVAKGDKVKGFAIAGADGVFAWADGEIKGDAVVLTSKDVAMPQFVRYGFASNPQATLYNREDLPALPFRTDKLPTAKKK